jgi:hypothetical protein
MGRVRRDKERCCMNLKPLRSRDDSERLRMMRECTMVWAVHHTDIWALDGSVVSCPIQFTSVHALVAIVT